MTKREEMLALRSDPTVHYNCAQCLTVPFAPELGMTRELAGAIARNFGGGMGCGGMCGAVTGALMVMGGLGAPQEKRTELTELIRREFGSCRCDELTEGLERGTAAREARCGALVARCLDYVCQLTGNE